MRVLLIVYNNDSFLHHFPIGLGYIATVFRNLGAEVHIYNQDLHHYPDEHLTSFLDKNVFDIVGYSTVAGYYQYKKLLRISEAVNRSVNRPLFILGGHGPTPEPEFFLKKTQADIIVMGEGEDTIADLIDALRNKRALHGIDGIAFRDGHDVVVNKRRNLIPDIDIIPFPAWDLFPMAYYRLYRFPRSNSDRFTMPVLAGRGCPFRCNFCYRMDEGLRIRSNESILSEIEQLTTDYSINYIAFTDELLMSSEQRVESLCKGILHKNLDIQWYCQGRLNFAKPDILKLMKKAGCVFINYGIEAYDDQVLKNMNKRLTTNQIEKGIRATLDAGISPGFNIIFGNIGENRDTIKKGVEFLLKYDDHSQLRTIRPVTPYPGSPLYYKAIEDGLLKDCNDFYENKHFNSDLLTVNFTDLTDDEFYNALHWANSVLAKNYHLHKYQKLQEEIDNLYFNKDNSFRGFRQT